MNRLSWGLWSVIWSTPLRWPPPTVLVNPSLIIMVYSWGSISIHLLRVRKLVRLTYQTFHTPYVIATQGQLYILVSYSRYIGLNSQLFVWISNTRVGRSEPFRVALKCLVWTLSDRSETGHVFWPPLVRHEITYEQFLKAFKACNRLSMERIIPGPCHSNEGCWERSALGSIRSTVGWGNHILLDG